MKQVYLLSYSNTHVHHSGNLSEWKAKTCERHSMAAHLEQWIMNAFSTKYRILNQYFLYRNCFVKWLFIAVIMIWLVLLSVSGDFGRSGWPYDFAWHVCVAAGWSQSALSVSQAGVQPLRWRPRSNWRPSAAEPPRKEKGTEGLSGESLTLISRLPCRSLCARRAIRRGCTTTHRMQMQLSFESSHVAKTQVTQCSPLCQPSITQDVWCRMFFFFRFRAMRLL